MSAARTLLAVLALAVAAAAARAQAQAPQITVTVDPPAGEVGRLMDVTLTVTGDAAADCKLIEPTPQPTGGRMQLVRGPINQQTQVMVNGRITRSLRTLESVLDVEPAKELMTWIEPVWLLPAFLLPGFGPQGLPRATGITGSRQFVRHRLRPGVPWQ